MVTPKPKKKCPPHHYIIDSNNLGVCKKCHAVQQFPKWNEVPKGFNAPRSEKIKTEEYESEKKER